MPCVISTQSGGRATVLVPAPPGPAEEARPPLRLRAAQRLRVQVRGRELRREVRDAARGQRQLEPRRSLQERADVHLPEEVRLPGSWPPGARR